MVARKRWSKVSQIFLGIFAKLGISLDKWITKEIWLFLFFVCLFLILIVRLFYIQVIQSKYYDARLSAQHVSQSNLAADRWHIYIYDKAWRAQQLTENILLYNVFVDPAFIVDKPQFIELITPIVYKHLCEINGMQVVEPVQCIKNIERFATTTILPKEPTFFYFGSGQYSPGYDTFNWTGYNEQYQTALSWFSPWRAHQLISQRLDQRIQIGIKPRNYIWFFQDEIFLQELKERNFPYITILYDNYVYVVPNQVTRHEAQIQEFKQFLDKYWYTNLLTRIDRAFYPQENRYVRILANASPMVAQMVKDLKIEYFTQRVNNTPILHGLGLETFTRRYYPYWSFLSHTLGYVNRDGNSQYGIEQYFDSFLRGQDWKIVGRASAWIGQVWANEFEIQNALNGWDLYLTIDPGIQKEIELVAKQYHESFRADSVSILIYDPFSGQIKWSATHPNYDPNNIDNAYLLRPLGIEDAYIIDDTTHIDIPVYINSGWNFRIATTIEREDPTLEKYVSRNIYGAQSLIDRNISMAYEPWSIFKAFTLWVGYDTDEIRLYDFYNDPGSVKVWIYTIRNIEEECLWDKSFLNAFIWSCNVWMVRIAQRVWDNAFYNYLEKLWFGQLTNIELAQEDPGFVEDVTTASLARFLNNTFGQWLLATPIQIAAAYGSLVNWWYYVQPTIIAWTTDPVTKEYFPNTTKVLRQIFKPETAEAIKEALFSVIMENEWLQNLIGLVDYTLWGKSWTSQIAFRGRYQQWLGWTNGSFVGLVTKDNPEYIVVVQVRRPRTTQWWWNTAGRVFRDVADFLLNYSLIDS